MEANKILLQRKFARIIESLAKEAHITEEEAMGLFYTSKTYQLISVSLTKNIKSFTLIVDNSSLPESDTFITLLARFITKSS